MRLKLRLPDWVIGLAVSLFFLFVALTGTFAFHPPGVADLELAGIVIFGLFITLVLPRLNTPAGAITTLGLVVTYGIVGTALFSTSNLSLKMVFPTFLLIFGYLLLFSNRLLSTRKSEESDLNTSAKPDKAPAHPAPKNDARDHNVDKRMQRARKDKRVQDLFHDLGRFRSNSERRPVLAHYELLREIGRGSESVIYKAREASTHRLVAIKVLDFSEFDAATATEFKDRLRRTAEFAALLNHPNIVATYDFGEEKGLAYIAMEYLKGSDLRRYLRIDHLLPLRETLNVVVQVADALNYAHAKGVLHGGINPDNVLWIRKIKKAKVKNFATTRIMNIYNNKKGDGLDFPYYMSPEQLSGKKTDGRSDIFSVGVLLFELLTGQKPFLGDDISSLMLRIAKEKHPAAKSLNARVPLMVEKIIDRALEKHPEKRYETAGSMARRLEEVMVRIDRILARKTAESQFQRR